MELPDEVPNPTEYQESDSVAVLICPFCHTARYVNQQFLDLLKELSGIHEAIEEALPRHKPCKAIMHLKMLEGEPGERV